MLKNDLLPVLLYVAQVWPLLRDCKRTVNKIVFYFVWGSKMDRLKRSIMFKSPENGGKRIPDLVSILMCTYVCNCLSICLTSQYKLSKCFLFLRYYLFTSLRKYGWVTLPMNTPYCWFPPFYLSAVIKFININNLSSIDTKDWTPRKIVPNMNDNDKLVVVSQFHENNCKTIWKNVSARYLTNRHKDVSWMAVHNCLAVREFMHRRGLSAVIKCPRPGCTSVESVEHLLIECTFAKQVLLTMKDLLLKFVPQNDICSVFLMYGLLQNTVAEDDFECAWQVACCIKDALWMARNLLVMQRKYITVTSCKRLIMCLINDYIVLQSRKYGVFTIENKWKLPW